MKKGKIKKLSLNKLSQKNANNCVHLSKIVGILFLTLFICSYSHATTSVGDYCPTKFVGIVEHIQDKMNPNPTRTMSEVTFTNLRTLKGKAESLIKLSFLKFSLNDLTVGDRYFISIRKERVCYLQKLNNI
jgi:hypothetical protein